MDDNCGGALIFTEEFYGGTRWSWISAPLAAGDRIRIRSGYEDAGTIGFFVGKSTTATDRVVVTIDDDECVMLAAAIEPHPYSREERIERAIEDLYVAVGWYSTAVQAAADPADNDFRAALFAILDAGV